MLVCLLFLVSCVCDFVVGFCTFDEFCCSSLCMVFSFVRCCCSHVVYFVLCCFLLCFVVISVRSFSVFDCVVGVVSSFMMFGVGLTSVYMLCCCLYVLCSWLCVVGLCLS